MVGSATSPRPNHVKDITMKLSVPIFALLLSCVGTICAAEPQPSDVSFKANCDGSEQRYMVILPADFQARRPHDVLIALHGHGSDRNQYVTSTRDECRGARDVATKYSMIFVSPDYRATTSWMGPKAEADVLQIIDELKTQYKVARVFMAGASMGGSAALTFAALHPDLIAGVSSQNGTANHMEYENFQDAIQASFGGTKQQIPDEYKKRSAELWSKKLTMPVAIAAGAKDTIVPPQSVVRLAQDLNRLKRKVQLIFREDGGHSTNYADTVAGIEFVIQNAKPASRRSKAK